MLTSPGHDGHVYTLTGPQLLNVPAMAKQLGRVLDRVIETLDIPLDVYRDHLETHGIDPAFVESAVNGARLIAAGGNATLTHDLDRVLARPDNTFASWVRDHRAAFTD